MGPKSPGRRTRSKSPAVAKPAAKASSVEPLVERQAWITDLFEAVAAVEGCSDAWVTRAKEAFEVLVPINLGNTSREVEPQIRALLQSDLTDEANGVWAGALARQVWADLKVVDDAGARARFPPLLGTHHMATPVRPRQLGTRDVDVEAREQDLDDVAERVVQRMSRLFGPPQRSGAGSSERALGASDLAHLFGERLADARPAAPEVAQLVASVDRLAEPPAQRLKDLLGTYRDDGSWPWTADELFAERLAKTQSSKMLRGGLRGVGYWDKFMSDRGLHGNKTAEAGIGYAHLFDMLVFEDRVSLQSRALETVCRKLYGKEKVFDNVHCREDWEKNTKDHPSKAKYELEDLYDVRNAGCLHSAKADAAVNKELQRRADTAKWLSKHAAAK